jgi:hypothetical protein
LLIEIKERTSPPPTTKTFLFLTCQATTREPPPWTWGNSRDILQTGGKFGLWIIGEAGFIDNDVGGDFRYGEQQNPMTKSSSSFYFSLSKYLAPANFFSFFSPRLAIQRDLPIFITQLDSSPQLLFHVLF